MEYEETATKRWEGENEKESGGGFNLGRYELALVFSYLDPRECLTSAALVSRGWLETARDPQFWAATMLEFSTTEELKSFFGAMANGSINYVLPSKALSIRLHYPLKQNANADIECLKKVQLCLKKRVVIDWLRNVDQLTLYVDNKDIFGSYCTGHTKLSFNTILLHIMDLCESLRRLKFSVDSGLAVLQLKETCQKPNTHLIDLKLKNLWGVFGGESTDAHRETSKGNLNVALGACPHLERFSSDCSIPNMIPLLGRTSGSTLRFLKVDSLSRGDVEWREEDPPMRFETLQSLAVRSLCTNEESLVDLSAAGKTVTSLTVNCFNTIPTDYAKIDSFLAPFVNLRNLYLLIHGDANQRNDQGYQRCISTLPSFALMRQLSSAYIDIMRTPRFMYFDMLAVLENLKNAPLRELTLPLSFQYTAPEETMSQQEMCDQIASSVGKLFRGRLERLHFFGGSGVSQNALYASYEAIDKTYPWPKLTAEVRKFNYKIQTPIGLMSATCPKCSFTLLCNK